MISMNKHKFKETEIGMIPEDWKIKRLGDVSRFQYGLGESAEEAGEYVYIRITDINSDGFLDNNNLKYINKNKVTEDYILNNGDVLVARTGATYGKTYFFREDFKATYGGFLIRFLFDKRLIDNSFFFQFSRSNLYWNQANNLVTGGAQPQFNAKVISEILVPLPSIEEQSAIAKILSDLDSKIELNQQMNKTLEKIGQAIFKRWFIDFEFPDEKGRPYKSSGGEMVNSELGKIPKGWEVKSLSEVADFIRGFSYNGTEKSKIAGELVFVTLNSIYEGGGFKREFSYLSSNRLKEHHFVREGDIVIANTEQTKTGTLLGFPGLVEFPYGYTKEKGCFSHHITKVSPDSENMKYFFYYHLFINQEAAVKYHTGSVIWALDVNGWSKNEKIAVPNDYLLNVFSIFAKALFEKRLSNAKESFNLSSIRDSLLPRLMSGRIRVNAEAAR